MTSDHSKRKYQLEEIAYKEQNHILCKHNLIEDTHLGYIFHTLRFISATNS